MKKLLLICSAIVVSLVVVLTSVTPVAAVIGPQRPQPQGCGSYCWYGSGPQQLHVDSCQKDWEFSNIPDSPIIDLDHAGAVKQYGNVVVVRWSGMDYGVFYRFYAIGVVGGPAVVYVVYDLTGDGILEKYTKSLDWHVGCGGG